MKTVFLGLLLCATASASPLDWLAGNYFGDHAGSQLLEHWEVSPDGQALGTTVWTSPGGVELQEMIRIRPQSQGRYQLDLWIWSSDSRKHLSMSGRLTSAHSLSFEVPPGQHPESLHYARDKSGNLQVTLAKKSLTRFVLRPIQPKDRVVPQDLSGDYEAHTFFSNHQFLDQLRLSPTGDGLAGSLEVPGKFTTPLENVQCEGLRGQGARLTFECAIPEGEKPYRVRYHFQFSADGSQALGHLEKADGRERLGSVILRRKNRP